jgi:3D (Asp-Asp-Asp) domain-containing protein
MSHLGVHGRSPGSGVVLAALGLGALAAAASCARPMVAPVEPPRARQLVVTATAYTSSVSETDGQPHLAAWSDRISPGMRVIAVSPDLLALGLDRGTEVRVDGLPGTWKVLDRMPDRWSRRIDVYMGNDTEAARRFGKRKVRISW